MTNCSICKKDFEGYGNNAQPVNDGICCDYCNTLVIRRRLFERNATRKWMLNKTLKEIKTDKHTLKA